MVSPRLISASRRTDIPAFFPDWFSGCLSRRSAEYRNPYSGRPASISLERDDVAAFVFWTRNPRPFLPVVDRLERGGYRSVFHVTVTGYPRELEPSAPPLEEALAAFRELSETVGTQRVLWRFDPILPGEEPREIVARFERISARLEGLSGRCTLSVAQPYRKSVRATRHAPGLWRPSAGLRGAVDRIAAIGRARGFRTVSCCSPLLRDWGIPGAACIDIGHLSAVYPEMPACAAPSPVREGCLCAASRDIGTYRTCRHGCLYCYAA
ncbi:MAG: DUF1848 family protein [Gemmatimonadota bacterium]